jgi:hypothetical protein
MTSLYRDRVSGECECTKFQFSRTCSHLDAMKEFAEGLTIYP